MKRIHLVYCTVIEIEEFGFKEVNEDKGNDIITDSINILKRRFPKIKYYTYFDKHKTNKKLKKIIDNINNSDLLDITFLTDKKDLFEFFDGEIYVSTFNNYLNNISKSILKIDSNTMIYNKLENLILSIKHDQFNSHYKSFGILKIMELLIKFIKYSEIFSINIKLLTKETSYKHVNNFKELISIIDIEDKLIFEDYSILTTRFVIILKRLFEFNLNQSAKSIGIDLSKFFNIKSTSYRYRNIKGNLRNKSFRGYKFSSFINNDEKIRIQEKVEIFKALKKYNVDENIIKIVLGKNLFYSIDRMNNGFYDVEIII
ncbi:hypothetical protein O8C83_05270 [Aliarcobacter butzleri]|uniref:hypothetical protein n=1 Tax=Aliarcobacter butzleri TaxID=28197 RepID=UPI00263C10A4|nr:hypothetical protein [Aliarcobacter butzleri]MDN5100224.1 hypothetical protein [Aliarcobacter butzleri]